MFTSLLFYELEIFRVQICPSSTSSSLSSSSLLCHCACIRAWCRNWGDKI